MLTSKDNDSNPVKTTQFNDEPRFEAENAVPPQLPKTAFARVPQPCRPPKPEKPSPKKAASNAKNAKRSTGPKTARGKDRASRNNTRHGLYSADVVLTTGPNPDDPAEYAAFRDSLSATVDPDDPVQRALIERVAGCLWRIRRAHRYENSALTEGIENDDVLDAEQQAEARLAECDRRLNELDGRVDYQLRRLALLEGADPKAADLLDQPFVRSELEAAAARCEPRQSDLRHPEVLARALALARADLDAAREEVALCEEQRVRIAAEGEAQVEAHRRLAAAIPPERVLFRLIRYESMLDRELYRALRELRHRTERCAAGRGPADAGVESR